MNAEIIAIGSEMLTHTRVDTNSLFLTEKLNDLGIEVVAKHVIGDDRARLTAAIRRAVSDSRFLLISGGLGPTEDDLTRDAVAAALGREQIFNEEICAAIEHRFITMNRKMPEINKRQAMVIAGARILSNDRGTAPGQWIDTGENVVILLPGPPHEMKSMFTRECIPALAAILPPAAIRTQIYRISGMSESDLDATIAPIYKPYENPVTTVLAHNGDLQVHLRARCATEVEASALLAEVGSRIELALGDRIYSRSEDPLETVVGRLLRERGETLAVAESATGGGLAERITSIPGSSDYFLGGFITYAMALKITLLGVPEEILDEFGPVSEQTAKAMAEGARARLGSTYALAVTGNAGPGTDGPQAPAGMMFVALASPDETVVMHRQWPSDRTRVRAFAGQMALDMLLKKLRSNLS